MPRIPPWLDMTTIRPRPAARMDGSSSLVSRTGPNTFVRNSCSHTSNGISSTHPTAAIPALCTRASGAPTAASMALPAAVIDAGSSRSSPTPTRRGSSAAAPVAARRRSSPTSGERIAPTTRHPSLYRWGADARPSPRDAPVMTTLRGSRAIVAPAVSIRLDRVHGRTSVRLPGHPAVPVPLEIWTGLALSLVEPLGIVDLGFRIRPGTGDGGRELRRTDGSEAGAIHEIGDVQDAGHHHERGEGGAGAEQRQPLGQLLGLRAARVVPIAEDACGNHHHGDQRGLPDERKLEGRSGKNRAP